jgi:hypothetical protein
MGNTMSVTLFAHTSPLASHKPCDPPIRADISVFFRGKAYHTVPEGIQNVYKREPNFRLLQPIRNSSQALSLPPFAPDVCPTFGIAGEEETNLLTMASTTSWVRIKRAWPFGPVDS